MELRDYMAVLRKYWRSITAVVMLGVLAAAGYSLAVTPTYTANTALFFSVDGASSASDLAQGTTYAQKQVESYVQVATSPMVLQPVITKLQLADTPAALAGRVKVSVPTNTSVIDVTVTDTSPQQAAAIAGAVADQLVTTVHDLSPDTIKGDKAVAATVITPAAAPTSPTSPKIAQNLAVGLLLGLFLGVGQAILRDTLDTRIRTSADVAEAADAPVIARIPRASTDGGHLLLTANERASSHAEAYRRLRTNLQYLDAGRGSRCFVITSSTAGEGKTTTAINTALTLSDAGLRVLLIDADLRKPSVADAMGLEGAIGLSDVLIDRAQFHEVVQFPGTSGLHVLGAGSVPPNPAELLGSQTMAQLLATVTQQYDTVVIDAPPLLPVTDAAILSRLTDGALVVVSSGEVRQQELAGALESIASVDGRVLGIVLNNLPRQARGYEAYHPYARRDAEANRPLARRVAEVDDESEGRRARA